MDDMPKLGRFISPFTMSYGQGNLHNLQEVFDSMKFHMTDEWLLNNEDLNQNPDIAAGCLYLDDSKPVYKEVDNVVIKEQVKLRPALVDEFLELDKQLKEIAAKHDEKKKELVSYIKEHGGFEDIFWAKRKAKSKFDPDKLYSFICEKFDTEVGDYICPKEERVINEFGLDALFLEDQFTLDDIPDECFTSSRESGNLEIPANRRRRKKNETDNSTEDVADL